VWVIGAGLWWSPSAQEVSFATGVKEPSSVNTDQTVNTDQKKPPDTAVSRKPDLER